MRDYNILKNYKRELSLRTRVVPISKKYKRSKAKNEIRKTLKEF